VGRLLHALLVVVFFVSVIAIVVVIVSEFVRYSRPELYIVALAGGTKVPISIVFFNISVDNSNNK